MPQLWEHSDPGNMHCTVSVVLLVLMSAVCGEYSGHAADDDFLYGTFPDDFMWGIATSAYSYEGAWNEDGKGPSQWDVWTHQVPSPIKDGSNGDVACDSYHKWREDVQLVKDFGADIYRFSVSWARVIPTGRVAEGVNPAGLRYYNNLINEMLENGLEPMLTTYHWDLPNALEEVGGWLNETIVDHYADYARLLFENYGDRVKKWITFNEPLVTCDQGYAIGQKAPGLKLRGTGGYQCMHNILKSHAVAYRIYESEFKPTQQGIVGILPDSDWYEPEDPNDPEHAAASERALMFRHGWVFYPVAFGDYPPIMRQLIDYKSESEGLAQSRLPFFTEEWKRKINGSWDFLALNIFTTEMVIPAVRMDDGWSGDQNTITYQRPEWPSAASSWLKTVPWGFRKLLNWIKNTYGNPPVYVTESGFSDDDSVGLNDTGRIDYYTRYINEMMKAVLLDGCNVKSYIAWSLSDNFEWENGYTERFGLYYTDFTSPNRTRTPKKSVEVLKKIFADNGFPNPNATVAK